MSNQPQVVTTAGRGLRGIHDAFSWLTVLPLPQPRGEFDRRRAATIMAAVPTVGIVLGAVVAVIGWGLSYTQLPSALIGTILVAVLGLGTRGMHLDGLADTVDGLGSYGDHERVRQIMRSGDVGPFGAATLVLVLLGEALAFGALIADHRFYAIALVVFLSRAVVPLVCRRGVKAAHGDGFGAMVAGSQRFSIAVWSLISLAAAIAVGISNPGDGPSAVLLPVVAVLVAGVFAWAFSRHCIQRNGGLAGDIIGATMELTTVLTAVVLLL
ncbi:adenosylcobinamide-GDP ribazoletransferase [Gordonia sp. (in: high G+C Gram-positive bacteria)]|uniref:adenosylcobinamide-GDP ribazoletransferase n=1 Tax=Gordonia sp. (in: high G+C Gram-positive bacteria) TaxID=84139 RepID=UPI003C735DEF